MLAILGLADTPYGGWLVAAFAVIVVIVVAVIGIVILDRRDIELDMSWKDRRFGFHRRHGDVEAQRLQVAMTRLADLEQAIVATQIGPTQEREARLSKFFTHLCGTLVEVLAVGTVTRYRASIWINDTADAANLRLVAMHGFDRNDPRMQELERTTTVAGWVIENRQEHYVPDCSKDLIYRPRRSTPSYHSMIAMPLGGPNDIWSVLTVDASVTDGLTAGQIALVRRFGDMATTTATLAVVSREGS